jgi:hypothetical protein
MAHYALVKNGVVELVLPLTNQVITDGEGLEQEALGQEFLAGLYGENPGDFIQCSYSGSFRGVYPGPGYSYDPVADVFVAPKGIEVPHEAV